MMLDLMSIKKDIKDIKNQFSTGTMGYSIHGHIFPAENRVGHSQVISDQTSHIYVFREHVGNTLSHVNNYWGNYGHLLLFAVSYCS